MVSDALPRARSMLAKHIHEYRSMELASTIINEQNKVRV